MESKLMPCKCGGEVEKFNRPIDGGIGTLFGVTCGKCQVSLSDTVYDEPPTEEDWKLLTMAWNKINAPMTTSEPTTGEIVRALRCVADDTECKECRYKYPVGNVILCDHEQMNGNAADHLESQEREIETLRAFHERYAEQTSKQYVVAVCGLTARAEQAEKERDALVKSVDRLVEAWENFKSPALIELVKQWRGQPQDGEGV